MTRLARTILTVATALVLTACGSGSDDADGDGSGSSARGASGRAVDLGLVAGYEARVIADGLSNPTGIAFSPIGQLALCDSGHGRVVLIRDGQVEPYITGFTTAPAAAPSASAAPASGGLRVGPLSAVWLDASTLAVTDAGRPDGEERILLFSAPGDASTGRATNPIPPTSADPADRGEGQLTGLSLSRDRLSLYLASRGANARSWLLHCDLESMQLRTFASADLYAIPAASPVATLTWDDRSLLALYRAPASGTAAQGSAEGLIVQWDLATARPIRRWSLPGLPNPTAMARIGATDELVVVAGDRATTDARHGKLARVRLPAPAPAAAPVPGAPSPSSDAPAVPASPAVVTLVGSALAAPAACAFGPDGRLYITQLGTRPDHEAGSLIAITGFSPR